MLIVLASCLLLLLKEKRKATIVIRNKKFPMYSSHACVKLALFKKMTTGIQYSIAAPMA